MVYKKTIQSFILYGQRKIITRSILGENTVDINILTMDLIRQKKNKKSFTTVTNF